MPKCVMCGDTFYTSGSAHRGMCKRCCDASSRTVKSDMAHALEMFLMIVMLLVILLLSFSVMEAI